MVATAVFVRETDPEVQAERCDHLGGQEPADGRAGDPSDELADDPAVRTGVIAVCGPGRPLRLLLRDRRDDGIPGQHLVEGQVGIDDRYAGRVAERPPHGNTFLAFRAEFWPVGGDRGVQIELTPFHQHVSAYGRDALGRGQDDRRRIGRGGRSHDVRHEDVGAVPGFNRSTAVAVVNQFAVADVAREDAVLECGQDHGTADLPLAGRERRQRADG
jgi:hypothetical protein